MQRKGFIAVDIDGTALVEKIDKNPIYGLQNAESNVRLFLIQALVLAQQQGYDIFILTARPEAADTVLAAIDTKVGTQNTHGIIDIFKDQYNITVKGILRAPAGLKGSIMSQQMAQYPQNTIGILLDDQLKQVNDVRNIAEEKNTKATAYDINSAIHMREYYNKIGCQNEAILIDNLIAASHGNFQQANYCALSELNSQIDKYAGPHKHALKEILDELLYRMIEPNERNYAPDIKWINTCAKQLSHFITQLEKNVITPDDTHDLMSKFAKPLSGTHSKRAAITASIFQHQEKANEFSVNKYKKILDKGLTHHELFDCNNHCQLLVANLLDTFTKNYAFESQLNNKKNMKKS